MLESPPESTRQLELVKALGEDTILKPGDRVKISTRCPVAHYRVPLYVRGKDGLIELIITPPSVNNEEEGFGRNTGMRRHHYREGTSRSGRRSVRSRARATGSACWQRGRTVSQGEAA